MVFSRRHAARGESPLTALLLAEDTPATWDQFPVVDKHRAINDLGMVVTLHRAKPGGHTLDPYTVLITWKD